ncbi:diphosphomevalonate decarboxylase [Chlamydiales bacterium]|nr:diphosphomevalonate decarboxylase [Chlamydiales bacterium]
MHKGEFVDYILQKSQKKPLLESVEVFAPANIALVKYWGKRNVELNLPTASSLSISLGDRGTKTRLSFSGDKKNHLIFNGEKIDRNTPFFCRVDAFFSLFKKGFQIETTNTIPTGAGLASSASAFASFTLALDQLLGWHLDKSDLSKIARLGSGSATRSLWDGFVKWEKGVREDGMDSYGVPLKNSLDELVVGLLIFDQEQKSISSREAMEITKNSSPLYSLWPDITEKALIKMQEALDLQNFDQLGQIAEKHALIMHSTMLTADPSICYSSPKTIEAMQKVWELRKKGLPLYFTQDAGPNLKLLFQKKNLGVVQQYFLGLSVI